MTSAKTDPVNHPKHYTQGAVECIEALEAMGIAPEHCRACVVKYLWRLNDKGNALQDAKKAQWYLTRLIGYLEADYAKPCHPTCSSSSCASPKCSNTSGTTPPSSTPPPAPSSCDVCEDSSNPFWMHHVASH